MPFPSYSQQGLIGIFTCLDVFYFAVWPVAAKQYVRRLTIFGGSQLLAASPEAHHHMLTVILGAEP
jgi:hypothetical protein